jgi:hypothetical protein
MACAAHLAGAVTPGSSGRDLLHNRLRKSEWPDNMFTVSNRSTVESLD